MAEEQTSYRDSRLDGLSGVFNAEYLEERLEVEFKRARRYKEALSCLSVDIDRFAKLNETYGKDFGDQVLRHVGNLLHRLIRDVDFVAREEEDEFIVVLPNTPLDGAIVTGEKAIAMVDDAPMPVTEGAVRFTVSVGAASYARAAMRTREELLQAAHDAMKSAKEQGGHQVAEMPLL